MSKVNWINNKVFGLSGAVLAFQNIDVQRIYESGLTTKIDFYASNRSGDPFNQAIFRGRPLFSYSHDSGTDGLEIVSLPAPEISILDQKIRQEDEQPFHFPLSFLVSGKMPSNIELHLDINSREEYLALTKHTLPKIINSRYNYHNPEHLSTAWLNIVKEKESPKPIVFIAPDLNITDERLPNGSLALSDRNIESLMFLTQ